MIKVENKTYAGCVLEEPKVLFHFISPFQIYSLISFI